jgi:multidrug efflux pump subunit AcrA (membrane-fusion protein)
MLGRFASKEQMEIVSAVDPRTCATVEVTSVGQVADPASGTYRLRLRIPNTDGRFTAGMVVTATVSDQLAGPRFCVPVDTVQKAYGQPPFVLLVDSETSRVVAREIELGATSGQHIEVTGGLSGGELLIVRGQHLVVPADRVNHQLAGERTAQSERREP